MRHGLRSSPWMVAAAVMLCATLRPSGAAAQLTHTRKSILTLPAAELQQYREVVRVMRALPVTDPRSWLYQSGIHQYLTPEDVQGLNVSSADKAEMVQYALSPPSHAQQNGTWAQCHQSQPDDVFLLWHRVYLHYFERIARKVSNQPTFALPYWDYTKGASGPPDPRRLPEPFRSPTYVPAGEVDARPNPLYAPRASSINGGQPLLPSVVSLASLDEDTFDGFRSLLENNPHNVIHGALGKANSLLMGATVWAAQDPIFWLHHANVDRLWNCWTRLGFESPTPAGNQRYTFIDENGDPVQLTLPQMETLARGVDYDYEEYSECPPPTVRVAPRAPAAPAMRLRAAAAAPEGGIPLGSTAKVVSIRIEPTARSIMGLRDFRSRPKDFRVRLELHRIEADAPVGVLYDVQIRRRGSTGAGRTVGVVSFFGRDDASLRMARPRRDTDAGFTLSFDVTDAFLARDVFPGGVPEDIEVVLVPTSGVENGDPTEARFNRDARPRIGEIQLLVLGDTLPRPD